MPDLGGAILPQSLPAVADFDAAEWSTRILRLGRGLPWDTNAFRVCFVFLAPKVSGTFLTTASTFSQDFVNGQAGSGALIVGPGPYIGWSSQFGLGVYNFTKVFLYDDSAASWTDLTTAASNDTEGDVTLPAEPTDALYLGYTLPRTDAGIRFEVHKPGGAGGTPAVGGDPLIIEYSKVGGTWATAGSKSHDLTSTFGSSAYIDVESPTDWEAVSVNGSAALYWVRLKISAVPATPGAASLIRALRNIEGLSFVADSERLPRIGYHWVNIDGLGLTATSITSRTTLPLPSLVRYRAERIGQVATAPDENLFRSALTGEWKPLRSGTDGTGYTLWKVSNEIFGEWRDLGVYYEPTAYFPAIRATGSMSINAEWQVGAAPGFFTGIDNPVDIRYSEMRLRESGTQRWYELSHWAVDSRSAEVDPAFGWSAQHETGAITLTTDTVTAYCDDVVGKHLFCNFDYRDGTSHASFSPQGLVSETVGGGTFEGPEWYGGANRPAVLQDHDRGLLLMFPGTTGVECVYYAKKRSVVRAIGTFARANDQQSGDGVIVSVSTQMKTLFSEGIAHTNAVDQTSAATIFAGTGAETFDVSAVMLPGEPMMFRVNPGAASDSTFDATALLASISFIESRQVTPDRKGDALYLPPDSIRQNLRNGAGGLGAITKLSGLKHQVFFFSDADEAEIWSSLPDGVIAVAYSQSESDLGADVAAFLNASGQIEFESTSGNRSLWVHTFSRGDRRAASPGANVPPETGGLGYIPRGTGLFGHDQTMSNNNLANSKILGFHALRRRNHGFQNIQNSDYWVGPAGIVASAFQPSLPGYFGRTRIIARDNRSTTIQFLTDSAASPISGYLLTWSR